MKVLLRKITLSFTAFLFAVSSVITIIPPPVSAADCDYPFYNNNDIVFYNPCAAECTPNDDPLALEGSTVIEKIWNFYANKGLKSVAIAGIMGNFSQESNFDPAVKQNQTTEALPSTGDGKTGYGLAQWTSQGRQAGLFAAMDAQQLSAYYGEGWGASERNRSIPTSDLNKLLAVQLNYSWDGDSTPIKSLAAELNQTTTVEGDAGSTVLFHKKYEASADNAAAIQERIDDATALFTAYGKDDSVTDIACGVGILGGVSSVEDAIPWAQKYVQDTIATYNPGGSHGPLDSSSGAYKFVYTFHHVRPAAGGYCWKATDCGQCVAMSGWFALKQTTDGFFLNANGRGIVQNYKNRGLPTGTEPRPFSIFSAVYGQYGHTGVVLGVLDNGDVITAEVNWMSTGNVLIWQGNMKARYGNTPVEYAYFDDRLGGDAAGLGAQ